MAQLLSAERRMIDTITLLHGEGVAAQKGRPLHMGYRLGHTTLPVRSLADLVAILQGAAALPHAYVVRGSPCEGAPRAILRRSRREPRHLVATPHQWLAVDVDARATTFDALENPERTAAFVRSTLPEGLRSSACYYAITGSCSEREAHVHLWFWLDRPYSDAECHRYLSGYCDVSLYKPTQPHFTALPFVADDPIDGRRRGVLAGETGWLGDTPFMADPRQASIELDSAVQEVLTATKGNRHKHVNRRAYHIGRHVASGAIERSAVITALMAAACQSGLEAERAADEVKRGLEDGIRDAPHREAWSERLQRSESGGARSSYLNAAIALSESPQWLGLLRWDERDGLVRWGGTPPVAGFTDARDGAPFRDAHVLLVADWLGAQGMSLARGVLLDVVSDVAQRNPYDPVRDMLDELSWDGTPRLDTWLARYLGSRGDAQWLAAAGRRWLISAVARAYRPGCKADAILVLEGAQGAYKSTALDVLGLGFTRELRAQLDDKDASDALHHGCWIAVLTELDAFKRTSRAESVKAFLSALEDHYRRAYGRTTETHKRSIVFAATTNDEAYLLDPTGNRRFWPVRCGTIDLDALRLDVEQLWGEAREAYHNGEKWWLDRDESIATHAEGEQHERLIPDPWLDLIDAYCEGKDWVTIGDILTSALDVTTSQQHTRDTARVQSHLRALGFRMALRKIGNSKRPVRGFERSNTHG